MIQNFSDIDIEDDEEITREIIRAKQHRIRISEG